MASSRFTPVPRIADTVACAPSERRLSALRPQAPMAETPAATFDHGAQALRVADVSTFHAQAWGQWNTCGDADGGGDMVSAAQGFRDDQASGAAGGPENDDVDAHAAVFPAAVGRARTTMAQSTQVAAKKIRRQ